MKLMRTWLYRQIVILTMVGTGFAGGADSQRPIQIEADDLTVEESTGTSTYTGNVAVTQGSRQLHAEEVRIFSEDEEIIRIVASVPATSESLAHYQQFAEGDQHAVQGKARSITYYVREERIEFLGESDSVPGK
ncbi:MAG: lipopolysaccharide transport periplasmic protein LptA [Gammaproteobacteria bacterium]|nr:lipopolysaccharide transport periplasmic protein LptA [Gammaproteobacteria bacterium]